YASLPLLEYCGHDGKMNLASYLPGSQGRQWLNPQICASYGVAPEDRTIGTKNLTVEATDSISVLVYVGAYPLDRVEDDGVDDVLKERLLNTRNWAGALWHIFRVEDADCIEGFLQKVSDSCRGLCPESIPDGSCYLDASLRRRLREECGVSGWTLLQFLGDAVLVPTGAPYQVRSPALIHLSLLPIAIALGRCLNPASFLALQMDSMVYGAVREAVGTLQGYI
uniref:Lysine-specific demethylase n=1 Tax=Chelonoidis abingdonii TaxID=106734 RepID=A0A8C0IYJ4_CHEAB